MKIRVQRPVQHPIVSQIAFSSICCHTRNRSLITREKSSNVSQSAVPHPYNGRKRKRGNQLGSVRCGNGPAHVIPSHALKSQRKNTLFCELAESETAALRHCGLSVCGGSATVASTLRLVLEPIAGRDGGVKGEFKVNSTAPFILRTHIGLTLSLCLVAVVTSVVSQLTHFVEYTIKPTILIKV